MRWEIAQWFEMLWWRRYLKHKEVESYAQWKKNYWFHFLDATEINVSKNGRVLECGCGPTGLFTILDGIDVVALDPLLESYTQLSNFDPSDHPTIDFSQSTIEESEFQNEFDTVFCINVINHVENLSLALKKLVGAMKADGQFIISIDCHNYKIFKWLFRIVPLDILHPHQYSLKEYQSLLVNSGLSIKRTVHLKSGFFFDYHALVCEKI